jgi:phage terminase small subunit
VSKLTAKQQTFVDGYAGNGTDAARKAGYAGSDNVLAQVARENLRKPHVAAAIEARQARENRPLIKDRQALQEFWSRAMDDDEQDIRARLKASELLGKSQAASTNNVNHGGPTASR